MGWTKAERLSLAAQIAPAMRAQRAAGRRVALTNKAGAVVGSATLGEVQEALLAKDRIELEVLDTSTRCGFPGCRKVAPTSACRPWAIARREGRPWMCRRHARIKHVIYCAGVVGEEPCTELAPRWRAAPTRIERAKGEPWRCPACRVRHHVAERPTCGAPGCSEVAPRHAYRPSEIARRDGRPWMCRPHARPASAPKPVRPSVPKPPPASSWPKPAAECGEVVVVVVGDGFIRVTPPPARTSTSKPTLPVTCAGWGEERCSEARHWPSADAAKAAAKSRKGRPWRCARHAAALRWSGDARAAQSRALKGWWESLSAEERATHREVGRAASQRALKTQNA